MEEEDPINSSPSILIPESPPSPDAPASPHHAEAWRDYETYTEPDHPLSRNMHLDITNEETVDNIISLDNPNTLPYHPSQPVTHTENANPPTALGLLEHRSNSNPPSRSDEDTNDSALGDREPDEPPAKLRRLDRDDEADGETCPVCLEPWSTSGEHRLVALKCGHLFGDSCVRRWLRALPPRARTCPTCKAAAAPKDIRCIYARRLVAVDGAETAALRHRVEQLETQRSRLELDLRQAREAHRSCLMRLESTRGVAQEKCPAGGWRFALERNITLTKDGGCRALAYNCRTYELYASQRSANRLFPGYGVRAVSCVDYAPGQLVHLHTKPIRDLAYSQPRDLLLSVGLDGAARLMERGVARGAFNCEVPLWSCCWDQQQPDQFYAGGLGGVVLQYDVRNQAQCVRRLEPTGDLSPVVSLRSTERGLLGCQLNSCWAGVGRRPLPLEGPFMSLSYDEETGRALVACRGGGGARGRLEVLALQDVAPVLERTLPGSAHASVLAKSCWVRAPGETWAAAHAEAEGLLRLHGLDGARSLTLVAVEPALDVCAARLHGDTLLAALSDCRLRIYKAVATNS